MKNCKVTAMAVEAAASGRRIDRRTLDDEFANTKAERNKLEAERVFEELCI